MIRTQKKVTRKVYYELEYLINDYPHLSFIHEDNCIIGIHIPGISNINSIIKNNMIYTLRFYDYKRDAKICYYSPEYRRTSA